MDGCVSFWGTDSNELPLCIRAVSPGSTAEAQRVPREPIFKLAWCGFPNMNECRAMLMAKDDDTSESRGLGGSTFDYANGLESALVVLGGLLTSDQYGISVVQFHPFIPPIPLSPTGIHPDLQEAMFKSLVATGAYLEVD